jgi:preprotein translocase subunit SecG
MKISLYGSLPINLFYAAFKLIAGIYYSSTWFGAEAAFYIILSMVRLMLLRNVRNDTLNRKQEYQTYRFCGVLLFAMNAALTGVVFQMVHQGRGYEYPGLLIYAAAIYAFFCFTLAIVNTVKYRNLHNPIMSAIKATSLARGLLAMFALQTAMFASFNDDPRLEQIMNRITGICVCFFIFVIAVFMSVRANKNQKKSDKKSTN